MTTTTLHPAPHHLEATVRPSLAFYNTCQEVDHLVATLKRLKGGRSTTQLR